MTDLFRASSGWQNNQNRRPDASRSPRVDRALIAPVHAVATDAERALCGARASVTGGESWTAGTPGLCPRCADLAKKQQA